MDLKTEIISGVLQALADVPQEVQEKVEAVLHIQLQEYEVQKKTTEITVHDGSSLGMVRKFIATKRLEGKSEKTLRKYQPELEKLVAFLDKKLYEVETYDLRLYLALYKEHRGVSNRTLDNIRKTISSFFSWMNDEGHIGRNPARALKQIKYTKEVKKPFTSVEREKLKNACGFLRDLALSEFLYASGLRVSEAVSLNRDNIDFATREAYVVGKEGTQVLPVGGMHGISPTVLAEPDRQQSGIICGDKEAIQQNWKRRHRGSVEAPWKESWCG